MAWWDRWFNRARVGPASSIAAPSDELLSLLTGGYDTSAGVRVSADTSMRYSAVLAAVTLLADLIAMMPKHMYRRNGDRWVLDREHPLEDLLNMQPNPYQTAMEFWCWLVGSAISRGCGYAEIEWGGDGWPAALWPLRSDRTALFWDTSEPRRLWARTEVDGQVYLIPKERLFMLPNFTMRGLVDESPLLQAREAVGLAIALDKFAAKYFSNGAHLGGVLKFPDRLEPEELERVEKMMALKHGGIENAHRVLILQEGGEFSTYGTSPKDAQALEGRVYQLSEISRITRIPLPLLSELSKSNYNSIEQLFLQFVVTTITPWKTRGEQRIGTDLLFGSRKTSVCRFSTDLLLPTDRAARFEAHSKAIYSGLKSIDEARDEEGLNPIPDGLGQHHFLQVNTISLEQMLAGVPGGGGANATDGDPGTRGRDIPRPFGPPPSKGDGEEGGEEDIPRPFGPPPSKGDGEGDGEGEGRRAPEAGFVAVWSPVVERAFGRVAARETADIARKARKSFGEGGFDGWLAGFLNEHAGWIERQSGTELVQSGVAGGLDEGAARLCAAASMAAWLADLRAYAPASAGLAADSETFCEEFEWFQFGRARAAARAHLERIEEMGRGRVKGEGRRVKDEGRRVKGEG